MRPLVTARAEAENAALTADLVSQQTAIPEPAATPEGDPAPHEVAEDSGPSSSSRPSKWAALPARIYEAFPLVCPSCGGSLSLIAFLTDPEPIGRILTHIGEPTSPPLLHPARGPPQTALDLDGADAGQDTGQDHSDPSSDFDPAEPEAVPEFEFDQSRHG